MTRSATAIASPNIALIKYWGDVDPALRLPANGSISMTLGGLHTRTRVEFNDSLPSDELTLQGQPAPEHAYARVSAHLDRVRELAGVTSRARVASESNFPPDSGIASSAAAFAALTLAASAAAGLNLDPASLSRLARLGSGSACRSIFAGFVEWPFADREQDSYARPLAPADHWHLVDLIAIVDPGAKTIGSTAGHRLASSSPLQRARLADAPRRLDICRKSILSRDFPALAGIVEQDSLMMHAVMMTSTPPLLYWTAGTVEILGRVTAWRSAGMAVCATIDAGPNVHILCPEEVAEDLGSRLERLPAVQSTLIARPGPAARLFPDA